MPICTKLTPNLIVSSIDRSLAFYEGVLGFSRGMTVPPDAGPFVFASVTSGPIEIFFNAPDAAVKEYPALTGRPIGLTGTMFIEVEAIEDLYKELEPKVKVVMPYIEQWYGMKEFAIADPDGYVITFAQRR
jgi:catechol 2,3-dioxygenase-like lactoylglutathione lyase family enzyme